MLAPAEIRALPSWAGEETGAASFPGHFVFLDFNGQIVVSYPHPGGHGRRVTYRFWLPNRVDPRVRVSITKGDESGRPIFTYAYTLANRSSAVSAIVQWSIVGPAMQEITVAHPAWKGYNARVPVAIEALAPNAPVGAFLMWLNGEASRLDPGRELGEFTVRSLYSPGLTTAYASAAGVLEEPDGEFPEAVIQQLIPLQRPHVWQKLFLAIGPRFPPGTSLSRFSTVFERTWRVLSTRDCFIPSHDMFGNYRKFSA
jgi:hypothetical protein